MSRSNKSKWPKSAGYEISRKREGKGGYQTPSKYFKTRGNRIARLIAKEEIRKEKEDKP